MNEYDSVGGISQIQDDNGNLRDDGNLLPSHDALNRLIAANRKSDGLPIAQYTYDGLNRCVSKSVQNSGAFNGFTRYLLDGQQEIEERDTLDVMTAQYLYGSDIDDILRMDRAAQSYYYHDDSLGSIEALTDASGNIIERTTYDAYGAPQFTDASFVPSGTTSLVGNPFLFTAQRLDSETGLYYYRNRHYNPTTGRFVERDPIGIWTDPRNLGNSFSYVGNNGINSGDPSGLEGERTFVVAGSQYYSQKAESSPLAKAEALAHRVADVPQAKNWTTVAEALARVPEGSIDSLIIIDHTTPLIWVGLLRNDQLDALRRDSETLQKIRKALSRDAKIYFYGCELGENERLERLAQLLGITLVSYTGKVIAAEGKSDEDAKTKLEAENKILKNKYRITSVQKFKAKEGGSAVWFAPTGTPVETRRKKAYEVEDYRPSTRPPSTPPTKPDK
jgi:RHS repeat-associated protein